MFLLSKNFQLEQRVRIKGGKHSQLIGQCGVIMGKERPIGSQIGDQYIVVFDKPVIGFQWKAFILNERDLELI